MDFVDQIKTIAQNIEKIKGGSTKEKSKAEPKIDDPEDKKIVTTEQELEGFYIVKAILREVFDINRLQYKDTVNYFGINLDGRVNQTICRLYLNSKNQSIFVMGVNDQGVKEGINCLDDIYRYSEFLKARVNFLTNGQYVEELRKVEEIR